MGFQWDSLQVKVPGLSEDPLGLCRRRRFTIPTEAGSGVGGMCLCAPYAAASCEWCETNQVVPEANAELIERPILQGATGAGERTALSRNSGLRSAAPLPTGNAALTAHGKQRRRP